MTRIHYVAADRTTAGHGIIGTGDKTAVIINQMGIVGGGGTAQHRHPMGIMTDGTGRLFRDHMAAMTGKI